jgi:hypothetical protein
MDSDTYNQIKEFIGNKIEEISNTTAEKIKKIASTANEILGYIN